MNDSPNLPRFSRRQATAGLAGGSVVAATMFQLVRAQDSATPDATEATEDASTGARSASDAERLTSAITRARESISQVQADLEAVTNEIDPASASDLLTQASTLVDDAEAAVATGDATLLQTQVRGARGIAETAQLMIVAQLTYPGLPSQSDRAARSLSETYMRVTELTAVEPGESAINLSELTSDVQAIYTTAYELHTAEAFAQAIAFARAASRLAEAGLTLHGQEPEGKGRGGSSRGSRSRMGDKPSSMYAPGLATPETSDDLGDAEENSVTPPAPEFGG